MSIETLSTPTSVVESDATYYHTEEIKLRHYFGTYAPECEDMLADAELSEADAQQLRQLSADYVIATAARDEHDVAARRTILQYASSELTEFSEESPRGLSRSISEEGDVSIRLDGRTLTNIELGIMYQLIEPSPAVLDRAARDAQPIEVVDDAYMAAFIHEATEADIEEPETADDLDLGIYEPEPAYEAHTLKDELRPLAGVVLKFGKKVARISGVRIAYDDQQKIAS
jgi:hypothetical protein